MKTQLSKLQETVSSLKKGNVKTSLQEILNTGTCCTGYSSCSRGWAKKNIWTSSVCDILSNIGIPFIYGNTAPHGGADGEYVTIEKGALRQSILRAKKDREIALLAASETEKELLLARVTDIFKTVPIELIRAFYTSKRVKGDSLQTIAWKLTSREGVFSSLKQYTITEIKEALKTL